MPTSEHTLILGNDFLDDTWTAECSCGWESGNERNAEADAIDDWENHCDVVFMEATSHDLREWSDPGRWR